MALLTLSAACAPASPPASATTAASGVSISGPLPDEARSLNRGGATFPAPMTDDQIAAAKGGALFHIPTALGAIVLSYNILEVKTKVKFSGANIVGIFLGDISKWNDPKLVADNPDLANMNQDTVTVHRSVGSGTTFEFTDYLSTVSPDWQLKVGKATSVNWPGGLGGSGNPG
ncbi:MAG: substrate-binding domain-containing protein, partial [Chloroflexota bacterium]|nr:substrate-binding domain-containing protein [Chloroflexota bacterium]